MRYDFHVEYSIIASIIYLPATLTIGEISVSIIIYVLCKVPNNHTEHHSMWNGFMDALPASIVTLMIICVMEF